MKKISFLSAALIVFAGCSQIETVRDNNADKVHVSFSTYVPKSVTKADITSTSILAGQDGFGLFGYYTDAKTYDAATSPINFMFNQQVTSDDEGTTWTYSPVKYWPNETANGTVDGAATSDGGADHLTFFAYAPYQEKAGDVITALPENTGSGDPKIEYTVSDDLSKAIDLLYGVAGAEGFEYKSANGQDVKIGAGLPMINLLKPTLGTDIKFNFKHALAKLSLDIQGAFDQVAAGGEIEKDTKITVESIEITAAGLNTKGSLNLNNTTASTPNWTDLSSKNLALSLTGEENLNAEIIDAGDKYDGQPSGVTGAKKRVLSKETENFYLIPSSNESIKFTVDITYYVTTKDENLNQGYSRIKNHITKEVSNISFEAGKAYSLLLVLGMETVKVSATVEGWGEGDENQVDLPINVQ